MMIYNILNITCKDYRIIQYQNYFVLFFLYLYYNFPWKFGHVHSVYTHVHPSEGNYIKDAEIIIVLILIYSIYNPYM